MTESDLLEHDLVLETALENMSRVLVVRLRVAITALPAETIQIERQYPAGWWQAVRERWCPAWWLRRSPVRYQRISIHEPRYKAVCPHLPTAHQHVHLRWMVAHQESR